MAYYLKKDDDGKKVLYSTNIDFKGYKFKPKKNKQLIKVSSVVVVDPKMINDILSIKFNQRFKKLMKIAKYVINDEDATSTDTALVLDEVALVKSILLNRYQKFLEQEKEELFLQKLRIVENQVRMKQVMIMNQEMYYDYVEEERVGKSR